GALGKKGYGYNVVYLLAFFKETLEQDEVTEVALVGVGNLGTAFLNYNFMGSNNTKIAMAFDHSHQKAGTFINDVPIYHIDEIGARLENVEVAILTVPASAAQEMADKLIGQVVKGILNFTTAILTISVDVWIYIYDISVIF